MSSVNCVQSAYLLFVNVRRFCFTSIVMSYVDIVVVMGRWFDYSAC